MNVTIKQSERRVMWNVSTDIAITVKHVFATKSASQATLVMPSVTTMEYVTPTEVVYVTLMPK